MGRRDAVHTHGYTHRYIRSNLRELKPNEKMAGSAITNSRILICVRSIHPRSTRAINAMKPAAGVHECSEDLPGERKNPAMRGRNNYRFVTAADDPA